MSTPAYKERLDALYAQYPKFKTCSVCGETKSHAEHFRVTITKDEALRRGYHSHDLKPMKDSTDVCAACNPLILTAEKLKRMTNAEVAQARAERRITRAEYAREMEARKSALLRPKKRAVVAKDWHKKRHAERWEWLRGEIRKDKKLAEVALVRFEEAETRGSREEYDFMMLLQEAAVVVMYKLQLRKKAGESSLDTEGLTLRKIMGEKLTTALTERWGKYCRAVDERVANRKGGGRKPIMPRLLSRLEIDLMHDAPLYRNPPQKQGEENEADLP